MALRLIGKDSARRALILDASERLCSKADTLSSVADGMPRGSPLRAVWLQRATRLRRAAVRITHAFWRAQQKDHGLCFCRCENCQRKFE